MTTSKLLVPECYDVEAGHEQMDSIDSSVMTKPTEAPPQDCILSDAMNGHHSGGRSGIKHSFVNSFIAALMPLVPKSMVKPFAKRYVAGETLDEAIEVVRQLNNQGIAVTMDVLGEFISDTEEALQTLKIYKQILSNIDKYSLDANVSVKLTALGLLLDESLCLRIMSDLASEALSKNNFIRIDMEDSSCTQKTLDLYFNLRKTFSNVGIVIQAYLRRSHDDIINIIESGAGNFRLCKGIYIEPRWIAYQMPDIINSNFTALLEEMFKRGTYVGIATHDERLVWAALKLIRKYGLDRDKYEFQMLLGVDNELRDMLVSAGHRVRVYVPFGKNWHAYCMRRLKENPRIAGYIISNIFKRKA